MADSPVQSRPVPSLKTGDGASAAQAGRDMELPGMPARTELAKKERPIESQVAEWVYERTGHGLKYMAMQQMAKEVMAEGFPANAVAKAMVAMYERNPNGTVTRSGLFKHLQTNGVPAPSTTEQRVAAPMNRAEEYRRQAAEAAR